MKFRKKPVVIEAAQYNGNIVPLGNLFDGTIMNEFTKEDGKSYLTIKTLEGDMIAEQGDWIIKGIADEFYPCKPDIFEQSYDKI